MRRLRRTPATSIDGVVGKLQVVVAAIDPEEFPSAYRLLKATINDLQQMRQGERRHHCLARQKSGLLRARLSVSVDTCLRGRRSGPMASGMLHLAIGSRGSTPLDEPCPDVV